MRYLVAAIVLLIAAPPLSATRDNKSPAGKPEVCFDMLEMNDVRTRYDFAVREANRLRDERELLIKEVEKLRRTLST